MKQAMKHAIGMGFAILFSACRLAAMDRWSALSMLESGNNDHAVGPAGEVSRFQIMPAVWNAVAPTNSNPADSRAALAVAQDIMRDRIVVFERRFHRQPTDFEFYVLWNAPSQLIGRRNNAGVTKAVAARAQRFCNLVASMP